MPATSEATGSVSYGELRSLITGVLLSGRKGYLEKASKTYASQLTSLKPDADSDGVIGYFRSHGVTFLTAAKYRLGYVGAPLVGDEQFRGSIAIPYLTPSGVSSIKFRRLADDGPKYLYHTGTKPRLYNTIAYFAADDTIGITEGEIDAIVATERLGLPSIGVPGAEMWQENAAVWAPAFKDFSTVIMLADGDPENTKTGLRPGRELGKRIAESLGWRVRVVECPEGEDVSSMVAAGRGEELRMKFVGTED